MADTTPSMSLPIPSGSTGLADTQAAFEIIDAHQHTGEPTDGKKLDQRSLDINDDLSLNEHRLTQVENVTYVNLGTPSTDALSTFVSGGNLMYRNGSGVAMNLTNGNFPVTSSAPTVGVFDVEQRTTDLTIGPTDQENFYDFTDSNPRNVALPDASLVQAGTFYVIKDATSPTGSSRISVTPAGSDTIDGVTSATPFQVFDHAWFVRTSGTTWKALKTAFGSVASTYTDVIARISTAKAQAIGAILTGSNTLSGVNTFTADQFFNRLNASGSMNFGNSSISDVARFNSKVQVTGSADFGGTVAFQGQVGLNSTTTVAGQFNVIPSAGQTANFSGGVGLFGPVQVGTTIVPVTMSVTGTIDMRPFGTSNLIAPHMTGSMTKVPDGTSYLVAGPGITITTGSNGSINIRLT